jgi:hypothetical protein
MAFKDEWRPRIDGVDDADSSAVNEIAKEVIRLGESQGGVVDVEMSDTSENAVQNKVIKAYVDGITGEIETALDAIISLEESYIGGES